MNTSVFVMIVTLAMPNGDSSVEVKPMQTADHCRKAAVLEASDPFVASVECSELIDGKLQLEFLKPDEPVGREDAPQASNPSSTG
ncbi:MAG: hypothetical protein NW216_04915 [Hyphomicrobium sp.]|nr:hypothetical protein [Hyphomicrobium sp.]